MTWTPAVMPRGGAGPESEGQLPRGGLRLTRPTLPPDRPLTRRRRRAVRERILANTRAFLDRHGYLAAPPRLDGPSLLEAFLAWSRPGSWCEGRRSAGAATPARTSAADTSALALAARTRSQEGLCDFLEWLVKDVAGHLHADQIGGANVTRLDRMLHLDHARLDHAEALAILGRRGFVLTREEALGSDAAASLVRFCGLLPVLVTGCPAVADPTAVGTAYLLPFGGPAGRGLVTGAAAGLVLELDPLLRFLLGGEPRAAAATA
jgi:hypothetical protein